RTRRRRARSSPPPTPGPVRRRPGSWRGRRFRRRARARPASLLRPRRARAPPPTASSSFGVGRAPCTSLAGVPRRLTRLRTRLRGALRRQRLERCYRRARRAAIDPDLAVFAAYWYRGYACNPRAIYEKARELVPSMRGVWIVNREAVDGMPDGVEHVVAGTPEYYDVIARASYCVNNVNFPNHFVKRPGSVHVMTHHGTPLKRMGLDERDSPVTRMDFAALMRRCSRWDYSVTANPHSTLVWERVYPLPYESLE